MPNQRQRGAPNARRSRSETKRSQNAIYARTWCWGIAGSGIRSWVLDAKGDSGLAMVILEAAQVIDKPVLAG